MQRLADLRSAGGGPRFIKPTKREVRYPTAMLDQWAMARNNKPILDFTPIKTPKETAVGEPTPAGASDLTRVSS